MAAPAGVGWQVANGYGRRTRQLRELNSALSLLQTEIGYGAVPLPEAFRHAAAGAAPEIAALLVESADRLEQGGGCTAGEALRASVLAGGEATALKEEDLQVLLALAPALGASGRSEQVRHIALARERLAAAEGRARDEQQRFERVARYLGLLGGAALALIMF